MGLIYSIFFKQKTIKINSDSDNIFFNYYQNNIPKYEKIISVSSNQEFSLCTNINDIIPTFLKGIYYLDISNKKLYRSFGSDPDIIEVDSNKTIEFDNYIISIKSDPIDDSYVINITNIHI